MKTLIVLFTMIFSISAQALQCGETEAVKTTEQSSVEVMTEVPKHLKGSTIVFKKADGSEEVLKSEEYMVVKCKHKRPVIKESTKETKLACKGAENKNIVSLKAVDCYSDVKKTESGSTATLKVERQVGVGLQYQRAITDRVYVGGEVDSNNGVGVLVGVGF